jgi:hypothetical protein
MNQEDYDRIANKANPEKMWFDFLKHTRPEIVKATMAYCMFWWMTLSTIFGFSMLVLFQFYLRRKLEQVIKNQKILEDKYMGPEIRRNGAQQPVIQYIAAPRQDPSNTGYNVLASNQMV